MIDTLTSSKYLLTDSDFLFWTLVVTILIFIGGIVVPYILVRRERKKHLNTFRDSKWFKASHLSYHQFKEARPVSKYLHREEIEKEILGKIANRKHIVLTGTPLRGKTRTMVECIRQLKKTSILIPYPAEFNDEIIFPRKLFTGKNRIVIFNDLQKFFEPGKDPSKLINKINENDWIIVANCRTIEEWNTVRKVWGIPSNILEPIEIPEADENLAAEAAALNGISLPLYFDGRNIGTVFVDLDEMRLRYDSGISTVQKQILKEIKKLFLVGIYNSNGEILLSSIKKLTALLPLTLTDTDWLNNMQGIIDKGFVSGFPYAVVPEQVYFDRIIEPQLSITEIISNIREAFSKKDLNFNKLIYSAETPQKALMIIEEFQKAGIKPDIYQYTMLMAKQESLEQGKKLLNKMIEEGISPNVVTYNTLIHLCED
ncbi:MAG: pentatricopeptide repeat-containing protein, partial [Nanoarchaeota archaeon]